MKARKSTLLICACRFPSFTLLDLCFSPCIPLLSHANLLRIVPGLTCHKNTSKTATLLLRSYTEDWKHPTPPLQTQERFFQELWSKNQPSRSIFQIYAVLCQLVSESSCTNAKMAVSPCGYCVQNVCDAASVVRQKFNP